MTSIDESDSKKRRKSNPVTDEIIQMATETGRSTYFLTQRERIGKLAEYPIYYPDH